MAEKERDFWDKLKILTAASIPVVVAIIAAIINESINSSQVNLEYTKLAINLLSNPSQEDKNLKEWAVDIVEKLGPVPITRQLRASLVSGQTVLSSYPTGSLFIVPNNRLGRTIIDELLADSSDQAVAVVFGFSPLSQEVARRIHRRASSRDLFRSAIWVQTTIDSQNVLAPMLVPPGTKGECVIFVSADRHIVSAYSLEETESYIAIENAFLRAEMNERKDYRLLR